MPHTINKNIGETPLEALDRFRKENNIDSSTPLTYAGRLDPLAEGLLIILSGDDVHKKEEFTNLNKSYYLDILWGLESDTYDVLGIPKLNNSLIEKDINKEIKSWVKTFNQPYPPYSSKTVDGKPLWQWAREDKLDQIEIPTKEVSIYNIESIKEYTISSEDLLKEINKKIDLVKGDFRQEEIKEEWNKILSDKSQTKFKIQKLLVDCSSGTYMRSLAHNIGRDLNTSGLAYSIKRYKVGDFEIKKET